MRCGTTARRTRWTSESGIAGAAQLTTFGRISTPGGISPQNWSLGSLPPGEEVTLTFQVHNLGGVAQVLMDYRDLAENAYSSALVVTEVAGDWRFYDVHLWEGRSVTPLGDAVYPQPGELHL